MDNKDLNVGFAKVDITPPLGVCMAGYYSRREAQGILDPLYASAVSVSDSKSGNEWVFISCDVIGIDASYIEKAKKLIYERVGFSKNSIMIHATHTHTGPHVRKVEGQKRIEKLGGPDEAYIAMLVRKLADVAQMAISSKKPATMYVGYGKEDCISFIRRFRMKDGSIKTNPGVGNPDIIEPIGEIDPTVGVVKFKYEDNSGELLVVNFTLHPDIIGGDYLSSDYPGHMRCAVKKQIPNCEVVFINGAAGDINHVDALHPNNTSRGYEYSKKVGNILAAEVFKVYQNLKEDLGFDDENLQVFSGGSEVTVPIRQVTKEQEQKAELFVQAFHDGSWKTNSMSDVADLAEAYQTLSLADKGMTTVLNIHVVTVGNIAFIGLPGEVFSDIGRKIKKASPYKHTFISSLTNGSAGYFPTRKAFLEGGYESKNNPFTKELEDLLIDTAADLFKIR